MLFQDFFGPQIIFSGSDNELYFIVGLKLFIIGVQFTVTLGIVVTFQVDNLHLVIPCPSFAGRKFFERPDTNPGPGTKTPCRRLTTADINSWRRWRSPCSYCPGTWDCPSTWASL